MGTRMNTQTSELQGGNGLPGRVLCQLAALAAVAAFIPTAGLAAAPDKSGVKPSVISLPKGAGSIEGLGESFEPQLNTGGSSYGVSISVPPGRAGLAPSVHLGYNSFSGNGIAGIGWSLEFMSVKRQTDKGFPLYDSGDTFVLGGEELVPLNNAEHDWRCKNERSFERVRQVDSNGDGIPDAWEVTERNGTKHTLGRFRGQNNRWSVVDHPEKASAPPLDRTYCWMLDSTTDLHGNRIEYEYIQGTGVLYPSRITYSHLANNFHEVTFQYEARPDAFDDYRPTFSARLSARLSRIEVRSQGQLVRAYNFAYDYQPGDLTPGEAALQSTYLDLGVTLLKRVVQVDRSGNDANYLPPLVFTYSGLDLTKAEQRSFASPPELDLAEPNGRVQLADLDGDGLPDLFATTAEGATTVQRVTLNRGESRLSGPPKLTFAPAKLVISSSPVDLGEPNTVVHDPKGKGLVDMSSLVDDGGNKRLDTFGNRARLDVVSEDRLGFSQDNLESTVIANPPAFVTYSQAGTRQMDVNFDKRGDFVNLEPSFGAMAVNTFYIDRTGNWVSSLSSLPPSYPLANTFQDAGGNPNPCVHLADMNGDRMLDLVCLAATPSGTGQRIRVSYWPLCGLGRYADERSVPASDPDTFDIGSADLKDVFVEDFTGDGLADVLVLDGSGPQTILTLRVNIAGQRWSPPYTLSGLPRYVPRDPSAPTIVRVADLNGNGSLDLLFRNTTPADTWSYVELLPRGAPSLVTGIDNGIGKRTAIVYGSAAEDEQLAREAGHPWRTFAPIALQVVRQIRTTSGLDLNGDGKEDTLVMEFRYRDPFYDGFEREFRGFAFAQRIDYGDDFLFDPALGLMQVSPGWNTARTPTGQMSGPSLVARYRFHTGAADQQDNDDYGGQSPPPDRKIDEFSITAGHEEEPLKGVELVEEQVDPVVLHSAPDGGFDAGCEAAATATTPEAQAKLTPDDYIYHRKSQVWKVRRLYRPAEALPYFADQNADGVLEDYRTAPAVPVPAGRFASQGITVLSGNGRSVSFAFAASQTTEVREANGLLSVALGYTQAPPASITKTFDYDNYGNQTVMRELGLDDPAYDDERITTITYAQGGNALSLWIIDKPDTVTTTDETGAFVAKSAYFYDGEPFVGVQGQIQNRALQNRRLDYVDSQQSIQAARTRYDAFGNIVETLDPLGNVRRVAWDAALQAYPVKETIVVGGGAPDLTIEADYDPGLGVMTGTRDFNGNVTSYIYDSFGRIRATVRPGDTPDLPTARFDYQPADPIRGRGFAYDTAGNLTLISVPLGAANRVTTHQREEAGKVDEYVTLTFTDGSSRALATLEEGDQPNTWVVRQATSYNLRGQVQSQWLPFQVSSVDLPQFPAVWPSGRPPQNDGVNPAIVATDFFYDPLGKQLRASDPPDTWGGPRRETRTQHLPFQEWLFDEEDLHAGSTQADTPSIESYDGLGRIVAVEESVKLTDTGEPGPAVRWRTEFRYDLNGQVIEAKDSQGNTKRMTYDSLKRMTLLEDPDRGRTHFSYDDASNLRESIDAKGQRITYTYDGANRVLTEDYHDGGTNNADVVYIYDASSTNLDLGDGTRGDARNARGQIASVRDTSGETHFSYDSRARIDWEVKRVRDSASQLINYRTGYAYDSADRLSVLTFPDGDEVQHTYNSRNLLSRIHGASLGDVIADVKYRPSGQMDEITYGNGVLTHYIYDPRLRVSELQTGKGLGPKLIDFAYTYDGLANVTRIEDRRDLTGQPEADQRLNSQNFGYDSLFRLVRVEYPKPGTSVTNHIDYRYDRIGNMLTQTSDITDLEGGLPLANLGAMNSGGALGRSGRAPREPLDPPGPHALTDTQSRTYQYDENGNIVGMDGLSLEWDFKDRLVAAENALMRATYAYDYLSRRITKTVHWKQPGLAQGDEPSPLNPAWRMTTTHYINRYFEVRNHDASVKYIWNKQTRVARLTASLAATTRIQRLRLHQGWNLVCPLVAGQFPVLDPANNSKIAACYVLSGSSTDSGWAPLTSTTTVPAGMAVWVYVHQETTVVLTGAASSDSLPALTGQGQFVGNVLSEPIDLAGLAPDAAWLTRFDPVTEAWIHRLPGSLSAGALTPGAFLVSPGRAIWTTGAASGPLSQSLGALQVRYYHQDHLGSTSVVTDRNGAIVEESSNYPFGHSRHQYQPAGLATEPYQFVQKERDVESGLHYFEARYLASVTGRFISVDPISTLDMKGLGRLPQNLNLYAYGHNNPLKYIDPMGLEVTVTTTEDTDKKTGEKTGGKTTAIVLTGAIIDETGGLSGDDLKKVQTRIVNQLKSDFKGSDADAKQSWNITVNIRIVSKAADLKEKDHVIRIVDLMPDHDVTVLGAVNEIGGKEVRIKTGLIPKKPSDAGNASLERTASHEIGHALGLRHDTDPDNPIRDKMQPTNLMRQTSDTKGQDINVHQIQEMQKLYDDKKLNQ
jgi:RHS repeat-associated protein